MGIKFWNKDLKFKEYYMKTLIIDIESDSLDIHNTNIFCIVGYDINTKQFYTFDCEDKEFIIKFFQLLTNYNRIVAHNGLKFDFQLLHKFGKLPELIDTLIDSKLCFSRVELIISDSKKQDFPKELIGSYSLKAFGYRLNNHKQEFKDFTHFSKEMLDYCKQDCLVCADLYNKLIHYSRYPSKKIRELEYKVAWLIAKQEQYGFYFDISSAYQLQQNLNTKLEELKIKLKKQFPPIYIPGETNLTPKVRKRNNIEIKGPYTNLILQEFNPASRKQIINRLPQFTPKYFTEKGNPIVNADTLPDTPYTKDLIEYLKINKDYSQLYNGDKSIMSFYNSKTKRIYGKVDSLGADTHRMTHNSPNMTQIPKTLEFRQSFTHSPNKCLIGIDADQLELMMLGYYLELFGNPEYLKNVSTGSKARGDDIHTQNQKAMKLSTRDQAKTAIYSILYGIGGVKLSFRINPTLPNITYSSQEYELAKKIVQKKIKNNMFDRGDCFIKYDESLILRQIDGYKTKQNFITNVKGYIELIENLIQQSNKSRTITLLDNRKIYCKDSHKLLNYLLQGGGAIFMKKYLVNTYKELSKNFKLNRDYGFNSNIHDAISIETECKFAEEISKILEESFLITSNYFNFSYPIKGKAKIGHNLYDIFKD